MITFSREGGVTVAEENKQLMIRELDVKDIDKGFLKTLENLSEVGDIGHIEFEAVVMDISRDPDHWIFVAEQDGQVVGTITLLIERKIIHQCGRVGRIEDVATRKDYEGRGIASALMQEAIKMAKYYRCYKIMLSCSNGNIGFYNKFGFYKHENGMRLDLW